MFIIGWAKVVQPLMYDRNNCMTQWLIGIFIPFLSSKDDLINCAGVGKRTLFNQPEFFPTPTFCSLFLKINQQTSLHSCKMWYNEARKRKAKRLFLVCSQKLEQAKQKERMPKWTVLIKAGLYYKPTQDMKTR